MASSKLAYLCLLLAVVGCSTTVNARSLQQATGNGVPAGPKHCFIYKDVCKWQTDKCKGVQTVKPTQSDLGVVVKACTVVVANVGSTANVTPKIKAITDILNFCLKISLNFCVSVIVQIIKFIKIDLVISAIVNLFVVVKIDINVFVKIIAKLCVLVDINIIVKIFVKLCALIKIDIVVDIIVKLCALIKIDILVDIIVKLCAVIKIDIIVDILAKVFIKLCADTSVVKIEVVAAIFLKVCIALKANVVLVARLVLLLKLDLLLKLILVIGPVDICVDLIATLLGCATANITGYLDLVVALIIKLCATPVWVVIIAKAFVKVGVTICLVVIPKLPQELVIKIFKECYKISRPFVCQCLTKPALAILKITVQSLGLVVNACVGVGLGK